MYKLHIKKFFIGSVLLSTLFTGCKVLNPSEMFSTDSNFPYATFEEEKEEYIIKPFDKLSVRIFTNDGIQLIDMESNAGNLANSSYQTPYMVEFDGLVKVPTLGRIKVAGLTIKETEKLFEEEYSKFYQKPFVLVNVTNRRVVVFTSGSNNGTVLTIENERFTLIEALAQSGGIDDFSKAYRIKLLRGNLTDPKIYLFNISSIEEMKKANMVLQANDIIYVEKRARYTSRTLNELSPYIALFNTFTLVFVTIAALK